MENIKLRMYNKNTKTMTYYNGINDLLKTELSNRELKKCPLMLCSLLKDRNDTEIYEDDILLVPYNREGNVVVKYVSGGFNVMRYNLKSCEVVGNIYQNPELIGKFASRDRYNQIKDKNSQGI